MDPHPHLSRFQLSGIQLSNCSDYPDHAVRHNFLINAHHPHVILATKANSVTKSKKRKCSSNSDTVKVVQVADESSRLVLIDIWQN